MKEGGLNSGRRLSSASVTDSPAAALSWLLGATSGPAGEKGGVWGVQERRDGSGGSHTPPGVGKFRSSRLAGGSAEPTQALPASEQM
ncbi:hypothetical protein Nmel_017686 [Mimus melanotis]